MKDTFIIRTEWADAIFELDPLDQAQIFRNLFYFHQGDEAKIMLNNLTVKLVWKLIQPNLIRNIDSYDKRKETSSQNGKLGGRPTEIILDANGNIVPKYKEGSHFIYLIYDTELKLHKIGETSDLLKRRLSIKRPTRFIEIVNFAISTLHVCQFTEKQILNRFKENIVNGDWLLLDSNDLIDVNNIINLKKPNKKPNETKEPNETLNVIDSVIVSVPVSVIENDNVYFKKVTNISFDEIWNLYDKKIGSIKKLQKKWEALSDEKRTLAKAHIIEYVKATPDKGFRANFETYINQERWTNEILKPQPQIVQPQGYKPPTPTVERNEANNYGLTEFNRIMWGDKDYNERLEYYREQSKLQTL